MVRGGEGHVVGRSEGLAAIEPEVTLDGVDEAAEDLAVTDPVRAQRSIEDDSLAGLVPLGNGVNQLVGGMVERSLRPCCIGIDTSSTTMSGFSERTDSSAAAPSATVSTSYPSRCMARASDSRTARSSSAMSTFT